MKKGILLLGVFLLAGCATDGSGPRPGSNPEKELAAYSSALKKRINRFVGKDYGVTFCGEGQVQARLLLGPRGRLRDCSLESKAAALDPKIKEGILGALKKASPFPPFPEALKDKDEWAFTILIRVEGLNMTRDDMIKYLKGEAELK